MATSNSNLTKALIIIFYISLFLGTYLGIASVSLNFGSFIDLSFIQLAILIIVIPTSILIYLIARWYLALKKNENIDDKTLKNLKIIPTIFGAGLALLYWMFLNDMPSLYSQLFYFIMIFVALILGIRAIRKIECSYSERLVSCFYIFFSITAVHTIASLFLLMILHIAIYGFDLKSNVGNVLGSVPTIIIISLSVIFTGSILGLVVALFGTKKKTYLDENLIDDQAF